MTLPDRGHRASLEGACLRYQESLGEEGLDYLRGRGLSPGPVAERFRIGLVLEPAMADHGRFTGRLAIPVLKRGKPVAFLFRCIDSACKVNTDDETHEGHAKVLGPPGDRRWLFNTDSILESSSRELDLVEGEWDPMALTDALELTVLGFPGAKSWTRNKATWKRLIKDFSVVRLWRDPDPAGEALAEEVKEDIPWVRIISPEYDPNKSLRLLGAGYLAEMAGL